MEMTEALLGVSWILSMVMMLAIGFSLALHNVQKQKSAIWHRAMDYFEEWKNERNRNTDEPAGEQTEEVEPTSS